MTPAMLLSLNPLTKPPQRSLVSLTSSDFTQHLLNDLHAPMVTVILEEQVLARPRIGTDASS